MARTAIHTHIANQHYSYTVHSRLRTLNHQYHINTTKMAIIDQSFGDQLDRLGINTTNKYNPRDLKDNCVFVTIAVLVNMSSDRLAISLGLVQGQISLREIFHIIIATCERRHGWYNVLRTSPYQPNLEDITQLVREHGKIGIGYYRQSAAWGHCVVAEMRRGKLVFMCYQHSEEGIDVAADIQQATSWGAFWFTRDGFQSQGRSFLNP
ncbi:hypothetical protein BKA61DRAFT_717976 [Leptodontidium sp. MPI-SDFR-AT-0119]|nr:hypothetical protein BKA61DRAFT_717976 [Leptodontidium sp. MPI-SDFR-AT-0119]